MRGRAPRPKKPPSSLASATASAAQVAQTMQALAAPSRLLILSRLRRDRLPPRRPACLLAYCAHALLSGCCALGAMLKLLAFIVPLALIPSLSPR
jgi:hypothetical protein